MPRTARIWEPGAIHHAVARAHCGSPIFAEDEFRRFVVGRGARVFAETGATCLAWSILDNHYHVLLRCEGPPGPTFARLNTAIACRVTRRRGERGAVFQDRFYNDTCKSEGSLLRRLTYVLGNPVHHRMVPTIDGLLLHRWSGLAEVLGLRPAQWVDAGAVLSLLDTDADRARRSLVRMLEVKAVDWARDGGDPAEDREMNDEVEVDGSSPPMPVTAAARTDAGPVVVPVTGRAPEPASVTRAGLLRIGWDPGRLIPLACTLTGAREDSVRSGAYSRSAANARAVVACVASDLGGFSLASIAPLVGVGATALVGSRRRGRELLQRLGADPAEILARSEPGDGPHDSRDTQDSGVRHAGRTAASTATGES